MVISESLHLVLKSYKDFVSGFTSCWASGSESVFREEDFDSHIKVGSLHDNYLKLLSLMIGIALKS